METLNQPAAPNPTAKAIVETFFRHRKAFLTTVGLVLLGTILLTLFTPREFQSEMTVLVRNARPDYLISPQANTGQIIPQDVTEERINSEIEVIRSKDVADAVVDPGWPAKSPGGRSEAEIKAHEKAVLAFLKHLDVALMRKSDVIHVSYLADSPSAATDTVQRLLAAFLAKQREIERSTGASSFFAAEAARYKRDLDGAREQLAAYQQTNQIVSLPGKESTLETQAADLDGAIRATQVELNEAGNRLASDRRELSLLPSRQPTQQRSIPNTQAVEALVADLNNYQNKRTALLTRYQPNDRLVTEVDQQIATTSGALAQARATNGEESTTDINPIYQQVRAAMTTGTTEVAALHARLGSQAAQRERIRRQLTGVESSTVDFNTLQSRVNELDANYQLYSQKRNEAEIADSMNQHQLVNVAVAENPTFSMRPYRPQVMVNLALGLFSALFLGACVVFFAELGRDTIAAPYELEAISSTPVLATVPFVASLPALHTARTSPSRRAAAVPSPTEEWVAMPFAAAGSQPVAAAGNAAFWAEEASASPAEKLHEDAQERAQEAIQEPIPEHIRKHVQEYIQEPMPSELAPHVQPLRYAETKPATASSPGMVESVPAQAALPAFAESLWFEQEVAAALAQENGFHSASAAAIDHAAAETAAETETSPHFASGRASGEGTWESPHRAAVEAPREEEQEALREEREPEGRAATLAFRSSGSGQARSYLRDPMSGTAYRLRTEPRGRPLFEGTDAQIHAGSTNGAKQALHEEAERPVPSPRGSSFSDGEDRVEPLLPRADAPSTSALSPAAGEEALEPARLAGMASDGAVGASHADHVEEPEAAPPAIHLAPAPLIETDGDQSSEENAGSPHAIPAPQGALAGTHAAQEEIEPREEHRWTEFPRPAAENAELREFRPPMEASEQHVSEPAGQGYEENERELIEAKIEPAYPVARPYLPLRAMRMVEETPSRLTPSQRAQLNRPAMARDRNGRAFAGDLHAGSAKRPVCLEVGWQVRAGFDGL